MVARTLELDIVDNGTIAATIGQAKRFQRRALRDIERSADQAAHDFRDEVRSRAEGRPGPQKVSGAYWLSISVTTTSSGFFRQSFQKTVTSNHPAAARLEFGYFDVDALGRHYNQPAFPHWRPAIDFIGPRWVKSFNNKVPDWWR